MLAQPSIAPISSLEEIQAAMDGFVRTRGWYAPDSAKPQEPRNLAASIALEAGEVLECFQWTPSAEAREVGAELADVILYAAQLANVMGIDLADAVAGKLAFNARRFPDATREHRWVSPAS